LANGEFVVQRDTLDFALLQDARDAGVDVVNAHVLWTRQVDQTWVVLASDDKGQNIQIHADFLVEARGRNAPKSRPDEHSSMRTIALIRQFMSAKCNEALTFSEPFENGWAWATRSRGGLCSIQLVLGTDSIAERSSESLESIHGRMYRKLEYLPGAIGDLIPTGPAHSRGIQPVLRGGVAGMTSLRVGDAAYCVDPLSGHGMYEAISGAFAAAPTINTLLHVPGSAELAIRFYQSRATRIYFQRVSAGGHFYSLGGRWEMSPFWAQATDIAVPSQSASEGALGLARRAVIDGGVIQEKEVLVTAEHPEGIRFVAGTNLVDLLRSPNAAERIEALRDDLSRAQIPNEQSCALIGVLKQSITS